MRKTIVILFAFTIVFSQFSCEKDDDDLTRTITGIGEVVSKTLTLNAFTSVQLDGVSNIYLTAGGEQSVVLKAQQNIIDIMTWEVIADRLIIGIEDNIKIREHEEIRFEITIPALYEIIHNGVGDFSLSGGTIESLNIEFKGVGNIHAYSLPVNDCTIISSGVGDCKVMVNDLLDVDISGVGDVYYKGNPEINSSVTGVGSLINDN
jgi:hypothetical protein